jgi:two-component system cell cycle response regulator DivK
MQKKILVVEDHNDCRELLMIQLRTMGYRVVEAATGEDAIWKALDEIPDLIIMDLGLPVISGIDATIKLKEDKKTAQIPVVALTARDDAAHKKRAKKAGIEAFFTKPMAQLRSPLSEKLKI